MAKTITITDTGTNTVGGSATFVKVNSGTAISFEATTIRAEFGTQVPSQDTLRAEATGEFAFNNPIITSTVVPRMTIQGHIEITAVGGVVEKNTLMNQLIELRNTKGIKRLSGGIALTASMPEAFDSSLDYINCIIKNVTFTENSTDTIDLVAYTIQVEQVN